MATKYGNQYHSYEGTFQTFIVYSTSTTNTNVTITSDYYIKAVTAIRKNSVMSFGMKYSLSGTHSGSYREDTPTMPAGVTKKIFSRSTTISRGTSAKTWSVKFYASNELMPAGDTSDSSVVTLSITVPALDNWKVTYDANGGSGAPSTQTKYRGQTLTISNTVPKKSGYHFVRWVSSGRTDGTAYFQPGSATNYEGAQKLVAEWAANTFVISYNANGGTQSSSAASQYPISTTKSTKSYNGSVNLYDVSTFGLTKAGYHVESGIEWNRKADGTGTSYSQSKDHPWTTFGSTTTANTNVTLYANWKINKYTITFNANGGTGAPRTITKTHNDTTTYIPSTVPTRAGYTFKRWKSTGRTDIYYRPGERVDYNGNQTLLAEWDVAVYSVSYNSNGGSGTIASQSKNYGTAITLSNGSGFTKSYHTLIRWNTAANGNGTSYSLGGNYTNEASTTLYAQWRLDYRKPTISNVNIYRVATSSSTTPVDDGEYIRVEADCVGGYYEDYKASTITVKIDNAVVLTQNIPAGTSSAALAQAFGVYDKDAGHIVTITVTANDSDLQQYGSAIATVNIPTAIYPIDLYGSGNTVYMGVMHKYVQGRNLTTSDVYVDGDISLEIDSSASIGTIDGDLYAALNDLGW